MNGEQRPGWYFAHAQDDPNLRILCMFEGTFSLDAAHMTSHHESKQQPYNQQQAVSERLYVFGHNNKRQTKSRKSVRIGRTYNCTISYDHGLMDFSPDEQWI